MTRTELARRMLPKIAELAPRAWTPAHDCALVDAIAWGAWGDELAQAVGEIRPGVTFVACRDRFLVLRRLCRMPEPGTAGGA